jgi:hypothetical protein
MKNQRSCCGVLFEDYIDERCSGNKAEGDGGDDNDKFIVEDEL